MRCFFVLPGGRPENTRSEYPKKFAEKIKKLLDHIKNLVVYYEGTVEENMRLAE